MLHRFQGMEQEAKVVIVAGPLLHTLIFQSCTAGAKQGDEKLEHNTECSWKSKFSQCVAKTSTVVGILVLSTGSTGTAWSLSLRAGSVSTRTSRTMAQRCHICNSFCPTSGRFPHTCRCPGRLVRDNTGVAGDCIWRARWADENEARHKEGSSKELAQQRSHAGYEKCQDQNKFSTHLGLGAADAKARCSTPVSPARTHGQLGTFERVHRQVCLLAKLRCFRRLYVHFLPVVLSKRRRSSSSPAGWHPVKENRNRTHLLPESTVRSPCQHPERLASPESGQGLSACLSSMRLPPGLPAKSGASKPL